MPQTPLTSALGYCTIAEFLNFADLRTVGDLVSDTDERETSLTNNDVLLAAIQRASGMVESAAVIGNRYLPSDLAALTGSAQQLLIGLVADLVIGILYKRRPNKGDPPGSYKEALDMLQQLREGERIFPTQESADAGLPEHQIETPIDVENRNGLSVVAHRYFGRRVRQYPQRNV